VTILPHYFVRSDSFFGNTCVISGENFHHLAAVRRASVGDVITVLDESGRRFDATVSEIARDRLLCLVIPEEPGSARGLPDISLYMAVLKGKKFDLVIQKAVEVGVSRIVPVMTERSIPDYGDKEDAKRGRWNRIAEEAAKQSLRSMIPEVTGILSFEEALDDDRSHLRIMAHLEDSVPFSEFVLSVKRPRSAAILVGPEGGFSPAELRGAREHGWDAVTFPLPQLRAETAAIVIPSIVLYELSR
jgi:16S rRNA (uracil1498-N3)-methyltransferase